MANVERVAGSMVVAKYIAEAEQHLADIDAKKARLRECISTIRSAIEDSGTSPEEQAVREMSARFALQAGVEISTDYLQGQIDRRNKAIGLSQLSY